MTLIINIWFCHVEQQVPFDVMKDIVNRKVLLANDEESTNSGLFSIETSWNRGNGLWYFLGRARNDLIRKSNYQWSLIIHAIDIHML